MRKRTGWMLSPMLALAVMAGGCGRSATTGLLIHPTEVQLPRWYTEPPIEEQQDVPASLNASLPPHLQPLAVEFHLPDWVIYGVVRSLGAQEFVANGTFRSFSIMDEQGESQVVIDNLYYDVPMEKVHQVLVSIAAECAAAETERGRLDVLGSFVHRRFGGLILFSLSRQSDMKTNLLLTSGKSTDPVELFSRETTETMPKVGWKEADGYTTTTMVGAFHYGNAEQSFRIIEEEAIRDLAKGLMFKYSHMQKNFIEGGVNTRDDMKEEVYKEDITLRMRGVAVRRRAVDMGNGLCLVEVCVPVKGVARQ